MINDTNVMVYIYTYVQCCITIFISKLPITKTKFSKTILLINIEVSNNQVLKYTYDF